MLDLPTLLEEICSQHSYPSLAGIFMIKDLDNLARKYDAFIKSDGRGFRRQARILQSIWREKKECIRH